MTHAILVAVMMTFCSMAMAEGKTMLFQVTSSKDEVTVGFAQETDVERIAKQLVNDGYIRAWKYGVARAENGSMVQKPLAEVVILMAETVRIEAVTPVQPVIAPPR